MGTRLAAELLGVSGRRAQQLATAGLGVKVDGHWVLDQAAVTAYLPDQRGRPTRSHLRSWRTELLTLRHRRRLQWPTEAMNLLVDKARWVGYG